MASYCVHSTYLCVYALLSFLLLSTLTATNNEYSQSIISEDNPLQLRSLLTSTTTTTTTTTQAVTVDDNEYNDDDDDLLFFSWDYRRGLPSFLSYHVTTYLSDKQDILNFVPLALPEMGYFQTSALLTDNDTIVQIITNDRTMTVDDLLLSDYYHDIVNFYLPFLIIPQKQWSYNQIHFMNKLKYRQSVYKREDYIVIRKETDEGYHIIENIDDIDHRSYSGYYWPYEGYEAKGIIGIDFRRWGSFKKLKSHLEQLQLGFNYIPLIDNVIGLNELCYKYNRKIEHLSLAYNRLGPILDFKHFYNRFKDCMIEELDLSHNKIKSIRNLEYISEMKALKKLDLSSNELTSFTFSAIIGGQSNLEELALPFNRINGTINFSFVKNTKLRTLRLYSNNIDSISNFNAIKYSNLERLDLGKNDISSEIDFKDLIDSNVISLDLSNNPIKSIKNFNANTAELTNLKWLYVKETNGVIDQDCMKVVGAKNKNHYAIQLGCDSLY